MNLPRAPKQLSKEAFAWWDRIVGDFDLDAAGLMILEAALDAFDRMRAAQADIKKRGISVEDRWGQLKQNPSVATERDSRAAMVKCLRELGLNLEPIGDIGRPPLSLKAR
jgi:P27 family predicted phage terminase small subunit